MPHDSAASSQDAVIDRYSGLARIAAAGGTPVDGLHVLLSARRVAPGGLAYGLDASADMLALARANAAQAGVSNARFLPGRIEAIPLPDQSAPRP